MRLPSEWFPRSAARFRALPPPSFEGWYFKFFEPEGAAPNAVIAGICRPKRPEKSYAFIQFLHGSTGSVSFQRYPLSELWADRRRFDVHIGPNHFSWDRIAIDLAESPTPVRGELQLRDHQFWQSTFQAPGFMGWHVWLPGLSCYHEILSLDHRMDGFLTVGQQSYNVGGWHGYMEKDWGRSFPRPYLWMQTNGFSTPRASFTAAAGIGVYGRRRVGAFVASLFVAGQTCRVASTDGGQTKMLTSKNDRIAWSFFDRQWEVDVEARLPCHSGQLLAPRNGAMFARVAESLGGDIFVRWRPRNPSSRRSNFVDTGTQAGIEFAGRLPRLSAALSRSSDAASNPSISKDWAAFFRGGWARLRR